MKAPALTQALLQELLHYDPLTGVFTWKHRPNERKAWNTRYAGKIAGFDWSPDGKIIYRSIRIFDWPFLGHRLAWLYMTGEWPKIDTDHRDRDGLNNRWTNLREATKRENSGNRGAMRNNKLGIKGVSSDGHGGFRATLNGKYLGARSTPEAASRLYEAAAKEYYGEFSVTP